jgi:hypothetical protein
VTSADTAVTSINNTEKLTMMNLYRSLLLAAAVGDDANKENVVTRGSIQGKVKRSGSNSHTSVSELMKIHGRWWSPNIYRNARLAGLDRDRAWREAFV